MSVLPTTQLPIFLAATLALIVTPGPVVLYIVARSVDGGRKAGLVSVLGSEIGNFVHVIAASLGLSAILLSSALAFNVVKFLGAAYLVFLGVRQLLTRKAAAQQTIESAPLRKIFLQGIAVAVLNPKTALFFFAFLPQFVEPQRGSVPLQIFLLGAILVMIAIVSDSLYAFSAGTAGQWLRGNLVFLRVQRYVTGSVYIGLGLLAAFSGKK